MCASSTLISLSSWSAGVRTRTPALDGLCPLPPALSIGILCSGISLILTQYKSKSCKHANQAFKRLSHLSLSHQNVYCASSFRLSKRSTIERPRIIPCFSKGVSLGMRIDLQHVFGAGWRGDSACTCMLGPDTQKGTKRVFVVACPNSLPAHLGCGTLSDRWFSPHCFGMC